MRAMNASALYLFASDIVDEGIDSVLTAAAELQTPTLAIAMAYHQARDLMPHAGDKPRMRYRRDGVFFTPREELWAGSRARPRVQSPEEIEAVEQLLARRDELGSEIAVEAWTVFLHNTGLGEEYPELASLSCFGDRQLSNLCPSNPDVADYAAALADDISSRGMGVIAEALSAQTFGHGHHHERSFTPIGAGDEALLALCFCEHCLAAAHADDIDTEQLAARARARVQAAFAGAVPLPVSIDALSGELGDELPRFLRMRERAVTALAQRVGGVVRGNDQQLSFMDLSGAVLGYDDGAPSGPPAAQQAWRLSIDPASAAAHADSYSILGYVNEPERLAQDVASYRAAIGETPLRVILRPGHPDTTSAAHLRDKVAAAIVGGADQVDFYNYGMYDHSVLARVPLALA